MKKYLLLVHLFLSLSLTSFAQSPVKWTYSAIPKGDNNYELHITATVAAPWAIYSQATPDGGPLPTAISFNKNPLVELKGKVTEKGTLKKKYEEVFEVDVHYYKDKVEFVQLIKVKGKAKTNVTGNVEFMACNDEQCTPPTTVPFTIALQ